MRRPFKSMIWWSMQCASALFSAAMIAGKLTLHWRDVSTSEILIVFHQGGFGHTIHGLDLVRRMFPGRRITVLYLFQRTRHNPLVEKIWPDVRLIFLPIEFAWGRPGHFRRIPWFIGLKSPWLCSVLKKLFPQKTVLAPEEIYGLARRHSETTQSRGLTADYIYGYFKLLEKISAPAPALPAALTQKVEQALARCAPRRQKLCCLYLRSKGEASDGESSSIRRIGSPIRSYWRAIQALNARGYLVLLVGDRSLDDETRAKFGKGVVDAEGLGISHDLLYLYAALESDVAVLECGGGSWLPIYRNMPHLVVNVLPFEFASPGGTIYYKSILRPNGAPEETRLLLGKMAEEYDFPGHLVRDNDADELREAVTDFLDHLGEPRPWGIAADTLADLPPTSWHRFLKSGISPVWLRRYSTGVSKDIKSRRSIA
ncbi:MAG TPA: hypothetical protein VFC38_07340 [Stellaceae bacterium]|nr:hypothetical protein [Stellaceae bacterium]